MFSAALLSFHSDQGWAMKGCNCCFQHTWKKHWLWMLQKLELLQMWKTSGNHLFRICKDHGSKCPKPTVSMFRINLLRKQNSTTTDRLQGYLTANQALSFFLVCDIAAWLYLYTVGTHFLVVWCRWMERLVISNDIYWARSNQCFVSFICYIYLSSPPTLS